MPGNNPPGAGALLCDATHEYERLSPDLSTLSLDFFPYRAISALTFNALPPEILKPNFIYA